MSDETIDYKRLAGLIAAELKDCRNCPHGVSEEQAACLREVADAYKIGKRAAIKVIVTTITGLLLAAIGWGIVAKIAEMMKK